MKSKYKMKKRKIDDKRRNKKAVALEYLFWMILGIFVLVLVLSIIGLVLLGKGGAAIEYIKDLFRGRG